MLGSKTTLAVVHELSWGILGRGAGGLKGTRVSGSGYNEVLSLGMLNVVDYVARGRYVQLLESASAPHPVVVVLLFQVCLRACMRTSTCACVWTCMHTYAQPSMCACTCICACARVRVHAHAYACACMCPRMRRWGVLVVAPQCVRWCLGRAYAPMCMCMHVHTYMHGRVCTWPTHCRLCTCVCMYICVYMDACVYGCVYASMILLDALRRCYWGFLSVHAYACVCVCARMCACMGACVCVFVFLCICVHVRLYARACGCTYALV